MGRILRSVASLAVTALPGIAQDPPAAATPQEQTVSARTLRELITQIESPTGREDLLAKLQALLAAAEPKQEPEPERSVRGVIPAVTGFFGDFSARVSDTTVQLVEQLGTLPERARLLWRRLDDPQDRATFARDGTRLAGIFAVALLGARSRPLASASRRCSARTPERRCARSTNGRSSPPPTRWRASTTRSPRSPPAQELGNRIVDPVLRRRGLVHAAAAS
jgi:hypothetical protein